MPIRIDTSTYKYVLANNNSFFYSHKSCSIYVSLEEHEASDLFLTRGSTDNNIEWEKVLSSVFKAEL